jgi:hypothetical protein
MGNLSRRAFLKGSAVGATAASFSTLFGYSRLFAQTDGDDPQTILNLAATAETFACVHYFNALDNAEALALTEREQNWLRSFLDSEMKHKQFLEANGAVPLATDFYVPENLFTDRAMFVETTNAAENWFVAAYLAATRRFAELDQPLLAATASQVSGVEAEHQALIRLMGGLKPSFQTLKEPLFWNTSEVVPFFQPFLEGGEGFFGPASYPGDDAIIAVVGGFGVQAVTPFISLNGMGTVNMDMGGGEAMATAEATAEMNNGGDGGGQTATEEPGNGGGNNGGGDPTATPGNGGGGDPTATPDGGILPTVEVPIIETLIPTLIGP